MALKVRHRDRALGSGSHPPPRASAPPLRSAPSLARPSPSSRETPRSSPASPRALQFQTLRALRRLQRSEGPRRYGGTHPASAPMTCERKARLTRRRVVLRPCSFQWVSTCSIACPLPEMTTEAGPFTAARPEAILEVLEEVPGGLLARRPRPQPRRPRRAASPSGVHVLPPEHRRP